MTPLERAARALHRRRMEGQHPKPDNYPWEALSRREQALLRVDAYAVIKSIREPSEASMEQAMQSNDVIAWGDYREFWQAHIDVILKGGGA